VIVVAWAVLVVEFVGLFEAPVALEFLVLAEHLAGFLVLQGPVAEVLLLEVFELEVLGLEVSRIEVADGLAALEAVELVA
jgi:hypothetical protein